MPKLTENLLKRIRNEKKNYDLIRARLRKNWTEEEAFEKTKSETIINGLSGIAYFLTALVLFV